MRMKTFHCRFFIVVGGALPYVFQYSEIHHKRNASVREQATVALGTSSYDCNEDTVIDR